MLSHLSPKYDAFVSIYTQKMRNINIINLETLFTNLLDKKRRQKESIKFTMTANHSEQSLNAKREYGQNQCQYYTNLGKQNIRHSDKRCWTQHPELRQKRTSVKEISIISTHKALLTYNHENNPWIYNSGTTANICYNKNNFEIITNTDVSISIGKAKRFAASGKSIVRLRYADTTYTMVLTECFYTPELGVNLLSGRVLRNKDYKIIEQGDCAKNNTAQMEI